MKVLGIDPGLRELGWAVVEFEVGLKSKLKSKQRVKVLSYGVILTQDTESVPRRLCEIGEKLKAIFSKYRPDVVGVETPFVWKNPASALKLGMVVGVCVSVFSGSGSGRGSGSGSAKPEIRFIAPISAKRKVAGSQFASKQDVEKAIKKIVFVKTKTKTKIPHHIWDAISIAIASV